MDYLEVIVGVAVFVMVGVWYWRQPSSQGQRYRQAYTTVIVALAAAIGANYLAPDSKSKPSPAELDMQELRNEPLIRAVLAAEPEAEKKLRSPDSNSRRHPGGSRSAKLVVALADLHSPYIMPALARADDPEVKAIMKAELELTRHLQRTNLTLCKEQALGGLQNSDTLDAQGKTLFTSMLLTMEAAYKNGRANTRPQAKATPQEAGQLLLASGFTQTELANLGRFKALPDAEACALLISVYTKPETLDPQGYATLTRYMLLSR